MDVAVKISELLGIGQRGFWGPIVETFEDYYYRDTNTMGFYNSQVRTKTSSYSSNVWGDWQAIDTTVSYAVGPNKGFRVVFNTPNYTFGVH